MSSNPTFEANISYAIKDMERLMTLLESKSKIPAMAKITGLEKVYYTQIGKMHISDYHVTEEEIRMRLTDKSNYVNYSQHLSSLLTMGNELLGFFLVYELDEPPGTAFIYGVSVKKKWRGTWATPYLKHQALLNLKKHQIDFVRFEALNQNKDTIKHALRAGARQIST